jgi:outer membrane protein assembly factor BamB
LAGENPVNWPQFHGPTLNNCTTAVGLPVTFSETEHVRWKTEIPGKAWCSPVIWDDQIWMTNATEDGHEQSVICIDKETGRVLHDIPLFRHKDPPEVYSTNSYASATPCIEEGRVYVHYGSFGTACLDTSDGRVIWSRQDLPCFHFRGPGASPLLYGEHLIIHFDGYDFQYVIALDKHTGKTVWKTHRDVGYGTDDGDIMKAYSTPIVINVAGRKQLISPTSKCFLAYDPATGKELWRVRCDPFSTTARPIFAEGLLFLNSGFGKADLFAIRPNGTGDVTDTHVVWKTTNSVPSKPSQLYVDGLLFMVDDQGIASCLDARTGKDFWRKRIGGAYSASPLYAEGRVYCFSEEGQVTVFAAKREYEELAVNQLAEGFMASPAVSGRALYLRSKQSVYRIED